MQLAPHYLTYTIYPDGEIGTGDPKNFSDACDEYADARDNGYECIVFRVDPPQHGRAGMMTDVTNDADDRIRHRLNKRYQEFPEWLAA